MRADLLGREVTPTEEQILECFNSLRALLREDLAPHARAGLLAAVTHLHQVVTGLALDYDFFADSEY